METIMFILGRIVLLFIAFGIAMLCVHSDEKLSKMGHTKRNFIAVVISIVSFNYVPSVLNILYEFSAAYFYDDNLMMSILFWIGNFLGMVLSVPVGAIVYFQLCSKTLKSLKGGIVLYAIYALLSILLAIITIQTGALIPGIAYILAAISGAICTYKSYSELELLIKT